MAIAATAVRDWALAREVWRVHGLTLAPGEGPIDGNFEETPVRLNPHGDAEVVWAQRLCPVRARLLNVPSPESGYFFGDVVSHDGGAVGHRMLGDQARPVFNVFERFERSLYSTAVAEISAPSQADVDALIVACDAAEIPCEDWTANMRFLCKQCSEGVPHEQHDVDLPDPTWRRDRRIGFAVIAMPMLEAVIARWEAAGPGRAMTDGEWTEG